MSSTSSGVRIVLLLVSAMVAATLIASSATASVGRPPDVRDAAAKITSATAAPVTPPDVRDAAVASASRVTPLPAASGFHWGDYAAGIGTGIGSLLILAGFLAAAAIVRKKRLSAA